MRCDHFRAEMMEKTMAARTRAERAVFVRHTTNCVECWNWLIGMCKRNRSVSSKLAYSTKMLAEDNQDEEFLRVVNSKEIIES
jgi:hypothetical protein